MLAAMRPASEFAFVREDLERRRGLGEPFPVAWEGALEALPTVERTSDKAELEAAILALMQTREAWQACYEGKSASLA
jgi:hypothetical protein